MREVGLNVRGIKETKQKFIQLRNFLKNGDRQVYDKIGEVVVDLIQKRTLSGKDIRDQKFKPYSSAYAKKKGTSFVDLEASGQMLGAMRKQPFRNKVRIYILKRKRSGSRVGNDDLARGHNYGARAGRKHKAKIPQREFFGLSKQDLIKLRKKIQEFYGIKIKAIFKK